MRIEVISIMGSKSFGWQIREMCRLAPIGSRTFETEGF